MKKFGIWGKRILAFAMACFLMVGPWQPAEAATLYDEGQSGNIKWSIDLTGHLLVEGSGDWKATSPVDGMSVPPWYPDRAFIKSATVRVTGITSADSMFRGCRNLKEVDLSEMDTSRLTTTHYMFQLCGSLKIIDFSNFDTSHVTDMALMFSECENLQSLDLSTFDTENVESMASMFYSCKSLTSLDISNFQTPNLAVMGSMFCFCSKLTNLNLGDFDVTKVGDLKDSGITKLTLLTRLVLPAKIGSQAVGLPVGDTTEENETWYVCKDNKKSEAVTEGSSEYAGCVLARRDGDTSQPAQSGELSPGIQLSVCPIVFSNLTDGYSKTTAKSIVLKNTGDTETTISKIELAEGDTTAFTIQPGDLEIPAGDRNTTWSVKPAAGLTCNSDKTTKSYTATLQVTYNGTNGTTKQIETDIRLNVNPITYVARVEHGTGGNRYVEGAEVTIVANPAPENKTFARWRAKKGTVTFANAEEEITTFRMPAENVEITPVYHSTTGKPEDRILYTGTSGTLDWSIDEDGLLLITGEGDYNQNDYLYCPGWNKYAGEIVTAKVSVQNITSVDKMFSGLFCLERVDVSELDTSELTSMTNMFSNCKKLKEVDFSNFNTSKVTSMSSMFSACENLEKVDLSNFDTSSLTSCTRMFERCKNLQSVNLSSFDLSKCQGYTYSTDAMFSSCPSLTSIVAPKTMGEAKIFLPAQLIENDVKSITSKNEGTVIGENPVTPTPTPPAAYFAEVQKGTGSNYYLEGETVTITADKASEGKVFDRWRVKQGNVTLADAEKETTTFQMPAEDVVVTPVYKSTTENPKDKIIASGTSGTLEWSIDEDGRLLITGEGGYQKEYLNLAPAWCEYGDEIVTAKVSVQNITSTDYMFFNLRYLERVDVSELDTSKVTSMEYMFNNCNKLEKVDLSNFDTSKVTSMFAMFGNCENLKEVDVSNFDTSSLDLYNLMFYKCKNLESVNLSSFDLSTLSAGTMETRDMLFGCTSLYTITTPKRMGNAEIILPSEVSYEGGVTSITSANEGTVIKKQDNLPTSTPTATPKPTWTPDNPVTATPIPTPTATPKPTPTPTLKPTPTPDMPVTPDNSVTPSQPNEKKASFGKLKAKAAKNNKTSVALKWSKVKGADGYIVYGTRCNTKTKKYNYQCMKTLSAKKTSYTAKKLKKGTDYRFVVAAYQTVNGKKTAIATSVTIYTVTKGSKHDVAKAVKIKKIGKQKSTKKITLKKRKTAKIKAKEIQKSKPIKHYRKMAYESSNKKVATVTKAGKIKAVGKGNCKIYVYAQNGVYKTIRVTVK